MERCDGIEDQSDGDDRGFPQEATFGMEFNRKPDRSKAYNYAGENVEVIRPRSEGGQKEKADSRQKEQGLRGERRTEAIAR
jgi:hypothetical protein